MTKKEKILIILVAIFVQTIAFAVIFVGVPMILQASFGIPINNDTKLVAVGIGVSLWFVVIGSLGEIK